MNDRIVVAVVQMAPVFLDPGATIDRVCSRIADAARAGAKLILFPEALLPGYPRGLDFGAVVGSRSAEGRALFARYLDQSIDVPGPETARIGEAARDAGCWVALGVVERAASRRGTLYCSLLYVGPDGTVRATHRKLKPTGTERLIWGEGDGSGLSIIRMPPWTAGGLICWENLMPLARAALYAKGVDIWLAPTADARDSWQATIRHIACEGRCFVLSCNQFVRTDMLPREWLNAAEPALVECRGGSAIVDPFGNYLAGPLYDDEGMVIAELDSSAIAQARFDFDVNGHYSRPDIFTLTVNESPARSVHTVRESVETTSSPLAPLAAEPD